MDPFLGEIRLFAFGRVPTGWHICDGSILQIGTSQALFSLLGNKYGGDGRLTFGLPDLRGRVPVCLGPTQALGTQGGTEQVGLTQATMPSHNHPVHAVNLAANQPIPLGHLPALISKSVSTYPDPPQVYAPYTAAQATSLDPSTLATAGGSAAHENRQPSLAMNYCIATSGIYPSRG